MLRIEVMSGPMDGHFWVLPGPVVTIGPAEPAEIVLAHDPSLAACGVRICWRNQTLEITAAGDVYHVAPDELFQVGSTWLRVSSTEP